MCGKCSELIGRGVQDAEELQEKLDNVQQRWNALQVCLSLYLHACMSVCLSV